MNVARDTGRYGGEGGAGHGELCEGDQVLVGYLGAVGSAAGTGQVVLSLQGQCAELRVTGGRPYLIEVRRGSPLPFRGAAGGTPFSALCPANQVLTSFFGREGSALEQVGFCCAPLSIADDPAMTVVIGSPTTVGPWGGATGGSPFADGCEPGTIARGHELNDSVWIDALVLRCGRPMVVP